MLPIRHLQMLVLLATALPLLLLQGLARAEDSYDIHNDLIAFTSLPGYGKIDKVDLNSEGLLETITINDTNYTIAPDAIFRDGNGTITPQASMKEGLFVEFYYLENTTKITKIWISTEELAEEHSRDASSLVSETETGSEEEQPVASPPAHPGEVILKDGVYQN